MELRITMRLDNAAFYDDGDGDGYHGFAPGTEVARILRLLAEQSEGGMLDNSDRLHDVNGNTVGHVEIDDGERDDRIRKGLQQHAHGLEMLAREIGSHPQ